MEPRPKMDECAREYRLCMYSTKQANSSLLPLAGWEMSTDHSAVMLCGWVVSMVHSTCGLNVWQNALAFPKDSALRELAWLGYIG